MSKIWIVYNDYSPTTPGNNRFEGLAAGFVKLGYKTYRVFIYPNKYNSKAPESPDRVAYKYLWEGKKHKNSKFRHIQHICWLCKFIKSVEKDDIIIAAQTSYLYVYSWFRNRHVYIEKSEYPELHRTSNLIINFIFKYNLYACRQVDGIFPISESLKEYFVSKGVISSKIHIVNMIVDPKRFEHLQKLSVPERYIAYCGAVSNFKDGVDVLIRSFAIVNKRISDINLYIIGDFPFAKDKEEDFKLVSSLGLKDKVVFTGLISRDEIPQILKNAEILVLARPDNVQSRHGFPTKLGEYLLTENPVVVTAVGDIPRYLSDGINAFVAKPGNIDDIANKIILALTSPDALQVASRGKQAALKNFNSDFEAQKIIDFIYGE